MKKTVQNNSLVRDMIDVCANKVNRNAAMTGVRALCRYFGGQIVYIPVVRSKGDTAEKLRGIIADATDDGTAEKMLECIMLVFGGIQVYFPLERCGFKREMAVEIFKKYDCDTIKNGDLCREYNISFTQVYNLWREGQKIKIEEKSPRLDFGQ
jgi:Mor family transcriptional regulator